MLRRPEPDLMDDTAQAKAYASADFDAPHAQFIEQCRNFISPDTLQGLVVDLGCGPGDISIRFAKDYPACTVLGWDGSMAMLQEGKRQLEQLPELKNRVTMQQAYLPHDLPSLDTPPAMIISNSLYHHLNEAATLWQVIKMIAPPQTPLFIMDLHRPDNEEDAKDLVTRYARDEAPILQHDFFHSLLAAYQPHEVEAHMINAGFNHMTVKVISDRHWVAQGVSG